MNNKSTRKPWLKTLLFLGILFCLIQAFSYIPKQRCSEKNGNYWPYFYKELPEKSLDIVFMGNSHSNSTFIPEIVDDILGTNSILMSTSGESIYQIYFEYQEVLLRQDPQVVVIETYPVFSGLTQEELKSWNYSFFFSMPLSLHKFVYAHHFFSDSNLINFYLPYAIFHSNWKDMEGVADRLVEWTANLKNELIHGRHVELPHQGYFNYMEPLSPNAQDPLIIEESDECTVEDMQERLAVVEDILKIDAQDDEGLIFFEAPQYKNEYAGCREQVVDLIGEYGIDHKRLFQSQSPSRLWFADDQHINQFGAVIASVETAEILADKLDIEIDEEAFEFYRSYFFKDYTLVVEDDQVTVNLIPFDDETPSNLYFIWTLEHDGEEVQKVEGIRLLEQSFVLPDPEEEYTLDVGIYNMSGSYSLRGVFDHIKAD